MRTYLCTVFISFLFLFITIGNSCLYGQGFNTSSTNWPTPVGGAYGNSGQNQGYSIYINTSIPSYNNHESWEVIDMNGDGLKDLVVTCKYVSGFGLQQFGAGTSPHWNVYLNNGTSFNSSPVSWTTPVGGMYNSSAQSQGYIGTYNYDVVYTNSQTWAMIDMNYDHLPDLVITGRQVSGVGLQQFGAGTSPYWMIYLNNGNGFNTNSINWSTPQGGLIGSNGNNLGYCIYSNASAFVNNSENWTTMDINNDGYPDLIITSVYSSSVSNSQQFGAGGSPYWKIYPGSSSGFASSSANWSTPVGGTVGSSSQPLGYNNIASYSAIYNNSETWMMDDMNNDHLPDLIVTGQKQQAAGLVQFGAGSAPYWKVFFNNGSGYTSTPVSWSTPVGGQNNSGGQSVGYCLYSSISTANANNELWSVIDMNNDHLPDLVVHSQYSISSGCAVQFGAGSNPYWKVFLCNGNGFSNNYTSWPTPTGGIVYSSGALAGFSYLDLLNPPSYNNTETWALSDINNDGLKDLVVTGKYTNGNGFQQFGLGSNPYWKVFFSNASSGISDMNEQHFLSLYPNPAHSTLRIETAIPFTSGEVVTIVDLSGRVIKEKLDAAKEINIEHLPSGCYFLFVQSDERTPVKLKFIKY